MLYYDTENTKVYNSHRDANGNEVATITITQEEYRELTIANYQLAQANGDNHQLREQLATLKEENVKLKDDLEGETASFRWAYDEMNKYKGIADGLRKQLDEAGEQLAFSRIDEDTKTA